MGISGVRISTVVRGFRVQVVCLGMRWLVGNVLMARVARGMRTICQVMCQHCGHPTNVYAIEGIT